MACTCPAMPPTRLLPISALKAKLDFALRPYRILGACNLEKPDLIAPTIALRTPVVARNLGR